MFVSPMLLHKFTPPFDNLPFAEDEYITELKFDGIRLILTKFDDKIRLYTRHNNEISSKFPELQNIKVNNGTVLDGELVVSDSNGRPDFEETMSRFAAGKNGQQKVQVCFFDIMYLEGKRVTHLPLLERKKLLESVVNPTETFALVQWMVGNGEAYFNLTVEHGLEGVVLKKANTKYQVNKRSHDWLKVINYSYADVYITGFRKDEFGLLLGIEEDNMIRPAGVMEFMTNDAKKVFYNQYKDIIVEENKKFIYLDPQIKCKVKYRNLTKKGLLRIPSFVEYIS